MTTSIIKQDVKAIVTNSLKGENKCEGRLIMKLTNEELIQALKVVCYDIENQEYPVGLTMIDYFNYYANIGRDIVKTNEQ